MDRRKPVLMTAALLLALSGGIAAVVGNAGAQAATTSLCQEQTASVSDGTYIVQNNEFDSSASECVTTDGNADFTVANSSIANATNGEPGAYPSIYQGCHWGNCSSGGLTSSPIEVSNLTTGKVTTSWSTTQPGGSSNAYDVAYDIWINSTPTTNGQPDGTEIMIWLNSRGGVGPFGSQTGTATVAGHTWNIFQGRQTSWNIISYVLQGGGTSFTNLDLAAMLRDSVARGSTNPNHFLIDVEVGFEIWNGGQGLATNSFSFNATAGNGGGGTPGAGAITGIGGKCVDVTGANPADGTQVQLFTCNGTAAQQWTVGTNGTVSALGKCLDAAGAGTANGTKVQLFTCNGTGAQQWRQSGAELINTPSGRCLDATGVSSADGTPLQLWDCGGGANQQWHLPA
jgi:cellulose 1,4-beta-cellobiosidase